MRRILSRVILVVGGFIAAVNLVIVGASTVISLRSPPAGGPKGLRGLRNLAVVDRRVLRGGAPGLADYPALAAAGVSQIVDLRAEPGADVGDQVAVEAGLAVAHLPVRDGQTPDARAVQRFVELVEASDGMVYLHCGAGVGRTGAMAAAYLHATGQSDGLAAVTRNLAVGPPSLEQLAYVFALEGGKHRPNPVVVALSRLADGPRRMLHASSAWVRLFTVSSPARAIWPMRPAALPVTIFVVAGRRRIAIGAPAE